MLQLTVWQAKEESLPSRDKGIKGSLPRPAAPRTSCPSPFSAGHALSGPLSTFVCLSYMKKEEVGLGPRS